MPINPICDKCHKELLEFGGILLSPPEDDGRVEKFHICKDCYEDARSLPPHPKSLALQSVDEGGDKVFSAEKVPFFRMRCGGLLLEENQ